MPVHFTMQRKQALRSAYRNWWDGALDRPLVRVTVSDAYPLPRETEAPLLSQASCADMRWTPEQLIDTLDAHLCRQEYLGDAFPIVQMTAFGPGVLAAMCGARLDNSSGAVWFFPPCEQPIADARIVYDPHNPWTQRIKAIYRAGQARWQGLVTMAMPDLGGVLDVVATFRGTENLLVELIDEPDEVLRLIAEADIAWQAAYDDFARVLQQTGQGYADWSALWSDQPSYIAQSDFCYMLGAQHFERFVLPSIRKHLHCLHDVIYHLDGIGQLKHLPRLLEEPALRAIQWVYGAGQPSAPHWLHVYRQIEAAGKGMMLGGSCEDFLEVARHIRHGLYFDAHVRRDQLALAEQALSAR